MNSVAHEPIAVIGLACRVPGAPDVEGFWRLVREGVHSVRRFGPDELLAGGETPERISQPNFVPAAGVLEDAECFDEAFFGISPGEAALMDPQIRVGLECARSAFDAAALEPGPSLGRVGVFVGASMSTYLPHMLRSNAEALERYGGFRILIGNDKDHLAGQIAYRLDLRGIAVAVGATCATSLVAIDLACRRLMEGDVDMALAGGVGLHFPQQRGYLHEPGGIYSRAGRCRAFDVAADGVTPGAGVAMVLLKPLKRALADGDFVHAVVLGSAVTGDGAAKVGYTAPSEAGQTDAIVSAWRRAGVDPREAGLIEGHGTGTLLGDAVELAALRRAMPGARCALGSVKSNIGHLDVAAGVVSFIKAVKAVETGIIPPTLHIEHPSPAAGTCGDGFFLPTSAAPWAAGPRRIAGISSFGIGGTNAHVVIAEPPPRAVPPPDGPTLLAISAWDEAGLRRLAANLGEFLEANPAARLRDVAMALAARGRSFRLRRARAVRDHAEALAWLAELAAGQTEVCSELGDGAAAEAAAAWLSGSNAGPLLQALAALGGRRIPLPTYPFARRLHSIVGPAAITGAGAQSAAPDKNLCDALPALLEQLVQRNASAYPVRTIDRRTGLSGALDSLCASLAFRALQAIDAFDSEGQPRPVDSIARQINADPTMTPLIDCLVGMVAEHGLSLRSPPSAPMQAAAAVRAIDPGFGAFAALLKRCADCIPEALKSAEAGTHALYSEAGAAALMAAFAHTPPHTDMPAAARGLGAAIATIARGRAQPVRVLEIGAGAGGLTEHLIAALPPAGVQLVVTDVSRLFVRHLEQRFGARANVSYRLFDVTRAPAPQQIAEAGFDVVVALDALHAANDTLAALRTLRRLLAPGGAVVALETTRSSPWLSLIWGLSPAWWAARASVRGPLRDLAGWRDTIAQAGVGLAPALTRPVVASGGSDAGILVLVAEEPVQTDLVGPAGTVADWLYTPAWSRMPMPASPAPAAQARIGPLVLLSGAGPIAEGVEAALAVQPHGVPQLRCLSGERFERLGANCFTVRPDVADDLAEALRACGLAHSEPLRLLHTWSLDGDAAPDPVRRRRYGLDSLIALAKALATARIEAPVTLGILTDGVCDLTGAERLDPTASLIDAPVQVIGREQPNVTAFRIDIDLAEGGPALVSAAAAALALCVDEQRSPLVALRRGWLWREIFEPRHAASAIPPHQAIAPGSSLLVLGGLGGVGRALAEAFAGVPRIHLALVARRAPRAVVRDPAGLSRLRAEGLPAPVHDTIARILRAGATVSLHPVDIADPDALGAVLAAVEREGGPVRGVVHAAGETDIGGIMIRRPAAATDAALKAKVDGIASLVRALGERQLELLVCCGSIGSLLTNLKFGEVGYVAANTHLVAATRALARVRAGRLLAISWTDWRESGMWFDAQAHLKEAYSDGSGAREVMPDLLHAISNAEGREALLRALSLDAAHVVVCAQPLPALLQRHARFSAADHAVFLEERKLTRRHGAPAAAVTGPTGQGTGELEGALTALWRELLGIDEIDPDDDFFELGGDSLLGIRILNRLRVSFGISDTLAGLMTAPTIRALAARVRMLSERQPGAEPDPPFEEHRL